MNMHRIRMMLICSLLAISLISLAGCESLAKSNEMDKISEERPENGLLFPDFSGNITDIRITTVERNVEVNMNAEAYEKLTQRQIYYGYLSDGQWYDMPCENYDLVGVIDGVMTDGYESAGRSHIVRIGPYLLVAICVQGYHDVAETTAEVTDSLNSKAIEMTEYSPPVMKSSGIRRIITHISRKMYAIYRWKRITTIYQHVSANGIILYSTMITYPKITKCNYVFMQKVKRQMKEF